MDLSSIRRRQRVFQLWFFLLLPLVLVPAARLQPAAFSDWVVFSYLGGVYGGLLLLLVYRKHSLFLSATGMLLMLGFGSLFWKSQGCQCDYLRLVEGKAPEGVCRTAGHMGGEPVPRVSGLYEESTLRLAGNERRVQLAEPLGSERARLPALLQEFGEAQGTGLALRPRLVDRCEREWTPPPGVELTALRIIPEPLSSTSRRDASLSAHFAPHFFDAVRVGTLEGSFRLDPTLAPDSFLIPVRIEGGTGWGRRWLGQTELLVVREEPEEVQARARLP